MVKNTSPYCKKCTLEQTQIRQRAFKQKAIEYLGRNCIHCGFDKHPAALHFHHKDPTQKDFSIGHAKLTKFNNKIKKELDKCIVLCANCHSILHANY